MTMARLSYALNSASNATMTVGQSGRTVL